MKKTFVTFLCTLIICVVTNTVNAKETVIANRFTLNSIGYNNNLSLLATEKTAYKSIANYNYSKDRNLNGSNIYIKEATATDARWKLISSSMSLCATTYGALFPIAIKGMEKLREVNITYYPAVYLPTVLASGAIPFVLTMDGKVKRGPVVAMSGMGLLAFANGPFLYSIANAGSIIDGLQSKNTGDALVKVIDGTMNTMVYGTVAASIGGYFGAKALELGPGESALITSNGRWMMLEGGLILGSILTYNLLPLINDLTQYNRAVKNGEVQITPTQAALLRHDIEEKGHLNVILNPKEEYGLTPDIVRRSNGIINTLSSTPIVMVGSTLLGCGAGYLATRYQSFTQGDVRIFNNMVFMSHLTFAAVLQASNQYKYTTMERALAIQALAYPVGAFLNQFVFGKYDFSYHQSRLIGIETQLFCLLGGTLGYLVVPGETKATATLLGAAVGANFGFLTYFMGTKKRIGRANYSFLNGVSNMDFALLPSGNSTAITPGVKLSYSFH